MGEIHMAGVTEASADDLNSLESISSNSFDDTEDETFGERLWGLTEMFPQSLRNFTWKTTNLTTKVSKVYTSSHGQRYGLSGLLLLSLDYQLFLKQGVLKQK